MNKKFRAIDSKALADTYSILGQMLTKLAEVTTEGVSLEDLPPSLVPTTTLYNIMICYSVLYDAAIEHELMQITHTKPIKTIH